MKWTNKRRRFFVLLYLAAMVSAFSQQQVRFPAVEQWQVFTDRTLYVAGESVLFSAFLIDNNQEEISKILYAEIISPDIRQVSGGKFFISNQSADGSLIIPDDIVTGFYYLRIYTKYMRNSGPASYTYIGLRIVNPSRIELVGGKDTLRPKNDQNNVLGLEVFKVNVDKANCKPREDVHVSINPINFRKDSFPGVCLCIVPADASLHYPVQNKVDAEEDFDFKFYPEINGLSISGAVINVVNGKRMAGTTVNFSIIGEGRDFMAMQTDTSGRYAFSLPAYTGYRDVFLDAEKKPGYTPKILVDNDYCTRPYALISPVFKLTAEERQLVYRMAINMQVDKAFSASNDPIQKETNLPDRPFYGTPSSVITFNSFVELPTIEEYFNELPTQVKVRKLEGQKYFKVIGTQAEMLIYKPLVLVDWVAVDDPSKILVLSPKSISRIEVVNEPYIKGNNTYGGIVSILSNEGNFAGIDLPESAVFINYSFLAEKNKKFENELLPPNIPDTRNTIYWEPNLVVKDNKPTQITFSAPDTPGLYQVIIKAINNDGKIIEHKSFFEVLDE